MMPFKSLHIFLEVLFAELLCSCVYLHRCFFNLQLIGTPDSDEAISESVDENEVAILWLCCEGGQAAYCNSSYSHINGTRRHGRRNRRLWTDDIEDWTGLLTAIHISELLKRGNQVSLALAFDLQR